MPNNICVLEFKASYEGDKQTDWVLIAPMGEAMERTQTWRRVKTLMPREDDDMKSLTSLDRREKWKVVGPAYEAWRSGNEIPEDGTPLAAWSGVTPEAAAILRKMGIRTVENVAEMNEATIQKLPFPNARQLPSTAKAYLENKSSSDMAKELAEAKERMQAMEEVMAEMQEKKRGPGRPRKDEAA